MNQLSSETSPYLLQHAQNPVYWKAWNDAALSLAITENKLLIISVGYSACHWCHVMEHESFEDDEVAKLMNAHFISIKADREERPDVDAVYMKAVQLMTGQGGWPMNVVALPDGRPIWGGTYFRKHDWIQNLEYLQQHYKSDPGKMYEYAEKLHDGLQSVSAVPPFATLIKSAEEIFTPLIGRWKKSFDRDFGGMARAPKFPMPDNYRFLMHYAYSTGDKEVLNFVDITLTRMAYGGIFDPVGGGFSRYSVDMEWHVPHFEKMLYDNGQLVSLYADAYKRTNNPLYMEVVEKTLAFVSRELTTPDGAFISALDADSLTENGHLEEGAYYVWTKDQLERIIGNEMDDFSAVFNINEFGHWENGNYVLIRTESLKALSEKLNIPEPELATRKSNWEKLLFEARENRPSLRRDDKCVTSWNALMLKGYADAYKTTGSQEYLNAALKNAAFIINSQWVPDGNLWHSFKNGKSTINGYLDDYALTIEAFITLYEITFDDNWILISRQLADYCFEHFFEAENGFFRYASRLDKDLVAVHFETEDNVIPASNSTMAHNLYRLAIYFENSRYREVSDKMLHAIVSVADYPSAYSNWLRLHLISQNSSELAICSKNAREFSAAINHKYAPSLLLAGTTELSQIPFLKNRYSETLDLFYVCRNQTCQMPNSDYEGALKDLGLNK